MITCQITKIDERASIPSKAHESDVGYDVTIIDIHKIINETTIMYKTGIKIKVDKGYYTEIVPRSSLVKTGHILANSVGIIDNAYTGELFIVVTKVNINSNDLELPFKGFQLIIKKQETVRIEEVDNIYFEQSVLESERADGGFGSSDTKSKKNI